MQETEKSAELAKSRRHAYQKRRSGQISESFETPNKAQMTSRVEGSGHVIPIFVGGELNSSFTSSGSLNDAEFDSPINVNRWIKSFRDNFLTVCFFLHKKLVVCINSKQCDIFSCLLWTKILEVFITLLLPTFLLFYCRRLLPPSYRSVLPAGRDYSIDKKTDMIFREFLKTDSATLLKSASSLPPPHPSAF